MREKASRSLRFLAVLGFGVALVALVRDTAHQGQDFEVFWRTAQNVLDGLPVYSVERDGKMSFKYPPWSVAFFLPFAMLPLAMAKWAWGLLEASCLIWVLFQLRAEGLSRGVLAGVAAAFWGIWAVHALDGQIALLILALSLWGFRHLKTRPGVSCFLVLWATSLKIFTILGAGGILGVLRGRFKKLLGVPVLLFLLSLPVLFTTPRLMQSWAETARSGGVLFEGEKVRGRENQGLPAVVLRISKTSARDTGSELWISLTVAIFLSGVWFLASRRLSEMEKALGWLALGCVVHPLAWFHLFVLAFPLAVIALDRAIQKRDGLAVFLAVLGIAGIAILTRRTLGEEWGTRLELLSVKSWGVVLCGVSLILSSRGNRKDLFFKL